MRTITHIVIHCSATREGQSFTADDIRSWHKAKGWKDIGYHFVIRLDGTVERGRDEDQPGAHVENHNSTTIGVCYVGGLDAWGKPTDTRTTAQKEAMQRLVELLVKKYPTAQVVGHRDFPGVKKDCPCFDAKAWWLGVRYAVPVIPAAPAPAPAAGPRFHTVQPGDTLWSLAQRYGVKPSDIYLAPVPTDLQVGRTLVITGGNK